MISIIAERAPADKQGPDISDPLITTDQAAIERGRNEIDAACSNRELVTSTGPLDAFISPGVLAEVADSQRGLWRGMVRSCAISITRDGEEFSADINLELERSA